jgi:hypothetical protein
LSVEIVYETHSITDDNEAGIATGWLPSHIDAPFPGRQSYRQVVEATRQHPSDIE